MSKERIGKVTLDLSLYSGTDYYSEGQSEDELLEAVKKYENSDYNRLITERKSWSFLYHLSHLSGNRIRLWSSHRRYCRQS